MGSQVSSLVAGTAVPKWLPQYPAAPLKLSEVSSGESPSPHRQFCRFSLENFHVRFFSVTWRIGYSRARLCQFYPPPTTVPSSALPSPPGTPPSLPESPYYCPEIFPCSGRCLSGTGLSTDWCWAGARTPNIPDAINMHRIGLSVLNF